MLAVKYLESVGLPLDRVRGQVYDGASVMSCRLGGVQKQFADLVRKKCGYAVPVPFVHCASHNLNPVINDAVEATISSQTFFGTIEEIYLFFGRSLNRLGRVSINGRKRDEIETKEALSN